MIEAVVVLAVLVAVTALATDSLRSMMHFVRLRTVTEDFLQSMQLARSEALKRNMRVTLCKSPTGATCTEEGGWHQGWIVFIDENNDSLAGPGEHVIRRAEPLPPDWRLLGNGLVESYVSYAPNGRTRTSTGAFQAGTITLCRVSGDPAGRAIVINNSGRARATAVQVSSCA